MADQNSSQDKNLPASQRKLEKAREEGQVARSKDLSHFAAVALTGAVLVAAAPLMTDWLFDALRGALRFDATMLQGTAPMGDALGEMTLKMLAVVGPMGAVAMLAALIGGVATGGWNWTLKPLAPQFSKLDPISGIGRVFSKQQLIDALKASLLALILGAIGAFWLATHTAEFGGVLAMPLPAAIRASASTIYGGVALLALALALFALIDVPLQRKLHADKLKMSHQELKQEHKESEGNAEVKVKVRARMREMTRRRMMAAVPKADLVVMNPTHYAVALKYDDQAMAAPRVVAKGADLIALRIRDLAAESKVPVLEAPVLARALYAHAKLDREIPTVLFAAVAQVLAYVYQLRAALAGTAPAPGALPELNVPAELDPHHTPVDLPEDDE